MAHNIHYNERTGKHAFFSVQQKAWHGLGQIVEDYPTSREAIAAAQLNYRVEKRRLFTFDGENNIANSDTRKADHDVPDFYATVRADNDAVLGVVGKAYAVVQNRDAFTFFDAIVGGDGIQYETAGALGKGERIFITAKLPSYIRVGSEVIEKYLFLTTSHDGLGSITAAFTPVRIVCNNTLNAALKKGTHSVKIRHTTSAKQRLEQAHHIMGISNELSAQLEGLFNQWTKIRITDAEVKKLIQLAMAPNSEVLKNRRGGKEDDFSMRFANTCDAIYEYHLTSPTQQTEATKGTVFGAYNAVTGYFQNVRTYKNGASKLTSLVYGGTAQVRTQKAFNLCAHFAVKGNSCLLLN